MDTSSETAVITITVTEGNEEAYELFDLVMDMVYGDERFTRKHIEVDLELEE